MIKSGFIFLLLLLLLVAFSKFGIFEFLASQKALWLGLGASVILLIITAFVTITPKKK